VHTAQGAPQPRRVSVARVASSPIRTGARIFLYSRTDLVVSTERTDHTVVICVCAISQVTGGVCGGQRADWCHVGM
jgi:hypothetical protein